MYKSALDLYIYFTETFLTEAEIQGNLWSNKRQANGFVPLIFCFSRQTKKKIGSLIIVKEQISQFHEIVRDCNK